MNTILKTSLINFPNIINRLKPNTFHLKNNIANNIINNIRNNIRNITYYTLDHEFIKYKSDDNTAKIGITHYAKNTLGEIVFIEKDYEIGDKVNVDDEVVTLESTKATGVLIIPIEGEIIEYNDELIDNLDDYNEMNIKKENNYWLVKLQLEKKIDTSMFLCDTEYIELVKSLDID